MRKRLISLVQAIVLSLALVLSGCGGGGSGNTGSGSTGGGNTGSGSTGDSNAGGGSGSGSSAFSQAIAQYGEEVSASVDANASYVATRQAWESADFSSLSNEQAMALTEEFFTSEAAWVDAMKALDIKAKAVVAQQEAAAPKAIAGQASGWTEAINIANTSTLPLDAIEELGALGAEAQEEYKRDIEPLFRVNDPYKRAEAIQKLNELKQKYTASGAKMAAGYFLSGAAGMVGTAASTGLFTTGALTIGGPLLVGAASGMAVKWLWNYCTSDSQKLRAAAAGGQSCAITSGQSEPGSPFNAQMAAGGELTIEVPGYVPIVIKNFFPPAGGNKLNLDFLPIPLTEAEPGDVVVVDFEEILAASYRTSSCTVDFIPFNVSGTVVYDRVDRPRDATATLGVSESISGNIEDFTLTGPIYGLRGDYIGDMTVEFDEEFGVTGFSYVKSIYNYYVERAQTLNSVESFSGTVPPVTDSIRNPDGTLVQYYFIQGPDACNYVDFSRTSDLYWPYTSNFDSFECTDETFLQVLCTLYP